MLDSSAVLALLLNEPGAELVRACLSSARLSTVNLAEVIGKFTERGVPPAEARLAVETLGLTVVDFDAAQAHATGALRPATKPLGLSLGDRACLALAQAIGATAYTADSAWARLTSPDIRLIRPAP